MLVMLTWWLSYEYVQNPRHALEDCTMPKAGCYAARKQVLGSAAALSASPPQSSAAGFAADVQRAAQR
jgi:hypothetical protein